MLNNNDESPDYKNGYNASIEDMLKIINQQYLKPVNINDSIASVLANLRMEIISYAFDMTRKK